MLLKMSDIVFLSTAGITDTAIIDRGRNILCAYVLFKNFFT